MKRELEKVLGEIFEYVSLDEPEVFVRWPGPVEVLAAAHFKCVVPPRCTLEQLQRVAIHFKTDHLEIESESVPTATGKEEVFVLDVWSADRFVLEDL